MITVNPTSQLKWGQSQVSRVNRGIAPVASMLASFVALEALRYLTGFAPPISVGKLICIDFATTKVSTEFGWGREAECDICSGVLVKDGLASWLSWGSDR